MTQQTVRSIMEAANIPYQYAIPFELPHQQGKGYYLNQAIIEDEQFMAKNWRKLREAFTPLHYLPVVVENELSIDRILAQHAERLNAIEHESHLESILPDLTLAQSHHRPSQQWERVASEMIKTHQELLAQCWPHHTPQQLEALKRFMNESYLTLHATYQRKNDLQTPNPTIEERILFSFIDERLLDAAYQLGAIPAKDFDSLLYYVEDSPIETLLDIQQFFMIHHRAAKTPPRFTNKTLTLPKQIEPLYNQNPYDYRPLKRFFAQSKAILLLPYEQESLSLSNAAAILNLHFTHNDSSCNLPTALFIRFLTEHYQAELVGFANQQSLLILSIPEPIHNLEISTRLTLIIEQLYAKSSPRYHNYCCEQIATDRNGATFWAIGNAQ